MTSRPRPLISHGNTRKHCTHAVRAQRTVLSTATSMRGHTRDQERTIPTRWDLEGAAHPQHATHCTPWGGQTQQVKHCYTRKGHERDKSGPAYELGPRSTTHPTAPTLRCTRVQACARTLQRPRGSRHTTKTKHISAPRPHEARFKVAVRVAHKRAHALEHHAQVRWKHASTTKHMCAPRQHRARFKKR